MPGERDSNRPTSQEDRRLDRQAQELADAHVLGLNQYVNRSALQAFGAAPSELSVQQRVFEDQRRRVAEINANPQSPFRRELETFFRARPTAQRAVALSTMLADTLIDRDDPEFIDLIDLVTAMQGLVEIGDQVVEGPGATQQRAQRFGDYVLIPTAAMLVEKVAPHFLMLGPHDLAHMYRGIYGQEPPAALQIAQKEVEASRWLADIYEASGLQEVRLSARERKELRSLRGDLARGLLQVRDFGVSPLIVRGSELGLSTDLLLAPPLDEPQPITGSQASIINFVFVEPRQDHNLQVRYRTDETGLQYIGYADESVLLQMRLLSDGALDHSLYLLPFATRKLDYFRKHLSGDGTVYLETLLTALAYDSCVPLTLQAPGGTVKSRLSQVRPQERPAVLKQLVIPRVKSLRSITPARATQLRREEEAQSYQQNRGRDDKNAPPRPHIRRLPEGYNPSPMALGAYDSYCRQTATAFPPELHQLILDGRATFVFGPEARSAAESGLYDARIARLGRGATQNVIGRRHT